MMVDIKPENKGVDWRPPDREESKSKGADPVEDTLKDYDFQALHDRIMTALELKTKMPMKGKAKVQ